MQINLGNKRILSFFNAMVCDIRDYKLFTLKFVGLKNFWRYLYHEKWSLFLQIISDCSIKS